MPHPLTPARTAQLCAELRDLRLRALAKPDGENGYLGVATLQIGLEHTLCNLVCELGGIDALRAVHDVMGANFSADDIAASKAQAAARQAAYLARTAAKNDASADARTVPNKAQIRAHYELQGALASFHATGVPQ